MCIKIYRFARLTLGNEGSEFCKEEDFSCRELLNCWPNTTVQEPGL